MSAFKGTLHNLGRPWTYTPVWAGWALTDQGAAIMPLDVHHNSAQLLFGRFQ